MNDWKFRTPIKAPGLGQGSYGTHDIDDKGVLSDLIGEKCEGLSIGYLARCLSQLAISLVDHVRRYGEHEQMDRVVHIDWTHNRIFSVGWKTVTDEELQAALPEEWAAEQARRASERPQGN